MDPIELGEIIGGSGESNQLFLTVDPFYYHSLSNSNLTFLCDYIAPEGNVNLTFPDESCLTGLDLSPLISGESVFIDELLNYDPYFAQSGEIFNFTLETQVPLGLFDIQSGERFLPYLHPSYGFIFEIQSGEKSLDIELIIPIRAQLDFDAQSGEKVLAELVPIYALYPEAKEGSTGIIDIELHVSEPLDFLDVQSGEKFDFDIARFFEFSLDAQSGERFYINHEALSVVPNVNFTHFYGKNTHTETSSCITLQSSNAGSGTDYGINAAIDLPYRLSKITTIKFKRTRASSWFDDDFSDAQLSFILVPGYLFSNFVWLTGSWNYARDILALQQELKIYLRYGNNSLIRVEWRKDATTIIDHYLTLQSSWLDTELDGTETCSITITTDSNGTLIAATGANTVEGIARQSGYFTDMKDIWSNNRVQTNDMFMVHYHNYQANKPEILCDLEIINNEAIVLSNLYSNLGAVSGYDGTSAELVLNTQDALVIDAQEGAKGVVDILLNPNIPFAMLTAAAGERFSPVLSTAEELPSQANSGETASLEIEYHPRPEFDLLAESGSIVDFVINAQMGFIFRISAGEQSLLDDLQINPTESIFLDSSTGEQVDLYLGTILTFDPIAASGEKGTLVQIDTVPPDYIYTGERMYAELGTTNSLTFDAKTGEESDIFISIHPSEPIGVFTAQSGELFYPPIEFFVHSEFYIHFNNAIWTQLDWECETNFHLITDECCGGRPTTNNLAFDLEYKRKSTIGEMTLRSARSMFSVNLGTRARFKFEAKSGETMTIEDYSDYPQVLFQSGSRMDLVLSGDLRHRLCKGYFIPNGNWVIVEFNDVLPEDCYADRIYSGETLNAVLANFVGIQFDLEHGEKFTFDLHTEPPILLIARSGEHCRFEFPWEVIQTYRTGEGFYIDFEGELYSLSSGEVMHAELKTNINVKFIESGCLDNEFIYQDDQGDAVPELANPSPVEGEPYKHTIKAICY